MPTRKVYVSTPVAARRSAPAVHVAFRRLDRDRDGRINRAEARRAGRTLRDFRRADTDGDGLLTPYEARFWF